jgi:hypothetical protein
VHALGVAAFSFGAPNHCFCVQQIAGCYSFASFQLAFLFCGISAGIDSVVHTSKQVVDELK